jgi:hypothetical protein
MCLSQRVFPRRVVLLGFFCYKDVFLVDTEPLSRLEAKK